ncbi:Asp-tRNA(Asn)/Glu-tRNA(Gln) amidotransferase subunit GatC [Bacillus sp. FJAT-50079]|uniref:Asp-tRNA(Asn)/Glu-tRNA(Gln) amidotransferase subunit GatC n=1 Tax=Bacillus sp. FJAT-50079 TaxID=2833577 RepID=UPI001BC968A2|nr:Asp-tRNA(Asn)/Glu-tRNA(Gln) amidotransferase subunit GatC [Bacillus sp. FJAT-50079]MBS4209573.1 Asp-tRNA(Asn)/Glu-tRNA(Gln) amidotransferase subunit GatC [Bacillus sp. FJAT-50079]
MSGISKEQVLHVANLARLEINDGEAEKFTKELAQMIEMAETLNQLDTANIEPTTHVFNQKNVMREDVVTEGLPIEQVMKNVPDHQDGLIKVPTIIE